MKIGTVLHGFCVTNERKVPELSATLYEMKHEKSGANLLYLNRKTDNKTFMISFRTTPTDDTGVFHILEHSVLEGSEKYPLKDPFVQLMKGSMNTFLNAFTFPDKTAYPVCSRNQKDFENLISVYLDAVFHPLIYKKEEIFLQEGWHYSFEKEKEPTYNGIVLNEMRGSYSSVDRQMEQEILSLLFPNNCYHYSSGGDPEKIPNLTYEKFLDAHRKYYHPANSCILLDGDLDLDSTLGVIEKEGLSGFDAKDGKAAEFVLQMPTVQKQKNTFYAVGEEEADPKCYYAAGYVLGDFRDRKKIAASKILAEYLAGSSESPLSGALQKAGLAESLELSVEDGVLQPFFLLVLRNLEEKNLQSAKKLMLDVLKKEVTEGLDKAALTATLNQKELLAREHDYDGCPQGIGFALEMLDSWQYGGDAIQNLLTDPLFKDLRVGIENGYFENLLKELFLENGHRAEVLLTPSKDLTEKKAEEEKNRLQGGLNALSKEEKDALLAKYKHLKTYQSETDEDTSCLPSLSLSDISKEPLLLPTETSSVADHTVLFHGAETSGITYLQLYFPLTHLSTKEASESAFLCNLPGNCATSKHSAREIQVLRDSLFGELECSTVAFQESGDIGLAKVFFRVKASFLDSNQAAARELLTEILTDTKFLDRESLEIRFRQSLEEMRQFTIQAGHSAAVYSSRADLSARGNFLYVTAGEGYFDWLRETEKNLSALPQTLSALFAKIFTANGLIFSVTATEMPSNFLATLAQSLPSGEEKPKFFSRQEGLGKTSISIPAPVSYAGMCANLNQIGKNPNGALSVLAKMISLDYLWQEIRVGGGAYGAGMAVAKDGNMALYTYRDPDAKRSIDVFKKIPEAAKKLVEEAENLTPNIIGTVAATEPLLLNKELAASADGDYFSGITQEDKRKERMEILETDRKKLLEQVAVLKALMPYAKSCVVGGKKESFCETKN